MSELGKISFAAGYVSSKTAAESFGVTNDYIARLCRSGKLQGVLEGRTWFVDAESLRIFFGRDLKASPANPVKIFYKETDSYETAPVLPGQLTDNPAMLSVCPPEAQGHVGVFFVPRRRARWMLRAVVLGTLFLATGTLGFGSLENASPSFAVRSDQVAAVGDSGFMKNMTASARAVAHSFDTVVYTLVYPDTEPTSQVVIVHSNRLCVSDETGKTCITKAQLDALLASVGASSTSTPSTVSLPATGAFNHDEGNR